MPVSLVLNSLSRMQGPLRAKGFMPKAVEMQ